MTQGLDAALRIHCQQALALLPKDMLNTTVNCLPLPVVEVQAELEQQAAELVAVRRAQTNKSQSALL